MGCTRYFVADRFEDLVDEGNSRSSSRAHEHENIQFHNCMWQSRHPEVDVYLFELGRPVSTNGSHRSISICIYVFVCLCLSLNVQQTNWYSRKRKRNVYRFPEHSNGTFVLSQLVSPFFKVDLGLVGLVECLLFVEQLLNPIPSSKYFSRKFSETVEVTHILFRFWFLQVPSW